MSPAARFTPALASVLGEGYSASALRADAIAGLTVAIVALPLSMAIAIASGVSPAQGLTTAIVGGFLVSALGGSRYQIGGPAGAFIVLVAAAVAQHGMDGLILATFLSGLMLAAMGWLRLGSFVAYIPFPVTVGFTAGIAVIIFASQIKPLLGLTLTGEPGDLVHKLPALWGVRGTLTPAAVALAALTVAVIVGLRRWRPRLPSLLIAVALAGGLARGLHLPVETIATAFGGIPSGLPAPRLPEIDLARVVEVLPTAAAFTMLGAIESLLSAVVADSMSGARHRPNAELVAQGVANVGAALFGGFCVTGTIARTATNVRAGAHGPVAGMLHAVFLLAFMMLAAPLAGHIPLAALAGVLAVVAWNMIEAPAIAALLRAGRGEAAVLGVTFALTILRDLSEAIIVGTALGALLFIRRISLATEAAPLPAPDAAHPPDVAVWHIRGALFFGATASIGALLDRLGEGHRAVVLDLSQVPLLDSTGAEMLEQLAHRCHRRGIALWLTGATRDVRRALLAHGVRRPLVRTAPSVRDALARMSDEAGAGDTPA